MEDQVIRYFFRRWGYLQADLDPFGRLPPMPHPDIDQFDEAEAKKWRSVYCSKVGAEFMHMEQHERAMWVADKLEQDPATLIDLDERYILERILSGEIFEHFIHTNYIGAKRFSLEGSTSLIPLLDSILNRAADLGFELAVLGMSHRGRLNTMFHIAGASAANIFAGFEDVDPRSSLGSGDVKYHRGATGTYKTKNGKEILVRLASNPSHLEAVNPILVGRVRARQERIGDNNRSKVLAIIIHGDAAFAGQGITAETLNMSLLPGYEIGGTVNIIVNNLLGFTAEPSSLHSSRFASDAAKCVSAPIFHVNGESPGDVVRVGRIAMDYRAEFKTDVFVDLLGYRRFGHSEIDDPTLTLPVLYKDIKTHPRLHYSYAKKIGVPESEVVEIEGRVKGKLEQMLNEGRSMTKQPAFFKLPDYWKPYVGNMYDPSLEVSTAIPAERMEEITERLCDFPEGFHPHTKISKGYALRLAMAKGEKPVDWGMAEILAFGSLLWEGLPVRISGQDSCRGTFNHRQAVVYDFATGTPHIPLQHLHEHQGPFEVYNSPVSEAAILGFELGFSRDFPEGLVCWEAQFGDFANGAQIITDQFVTAAEDKWGLLSGLTILLPHGYEGQGPEHSSARIERFLQLCGEDNIQVCQPTTAGQYFHLLRRQVLRRWRKPLVVFTPKSMLRNPLAASPRDVFTEGRFETILGDTEEFSDATKLLICTGKIVHDLRRERKKRAETETAIVSLEQMYPFPADEFRAVLKQYPKLRNVVWVQEEPANMGALFFVRPIMRKLADGIHVSTVRRSESASPATGSAAAHEMEHQALLQMAFAKYE